MDSGPLLALTVIVGIPVLFIATRIFLYPFTGLCLWVLLLPVTKTMADLAGYPQDEGPIMLQKLTLADPVLLLTAVGALLNGTAASRTARAAASSYSSPPSVWRMSPPRPWARPARSR